MMRISRARGASLVELLVAVTIFFILMGLLYPSFSFLQSRMSSINDTEALSERGNRILDYMAEKMRMTGFIIGSNPYITFCGEQGVNSFAVAAPGLVDGTRFDTITFLTASPIETSTVNMPYLRLTAAAARGTATVTVNTTNVNASYLTPNGTNNAKALVTFDVLKPTYPYGFQQWNGTVYTLAAAAGTTLTFMDDLLTAGVAENALAQDINAQSYVYAVRRYRFRVVDPGNAALPGTLQEVGWDSACTGGTAGSPSETFNLDQPVGPGNAWGGVDALQFEYYISTDPTPPKPTLVTVDEPNPTNNLPNVRGVRIWLLLRAGFPTKGYTNNTTYTVGNAAPVVFGDQYKRILLTRTVDIKNMGLWRP